MRSCGLIIIILIIIFVLVLLMSNNESIIAEHMDNLRSCVNNKLPSGPWKLTCDNQYFSQNGTVLNAECKNNEGTYTPTSIKLNSCEADGCVVHNNNGQLQCGLINQEQSCNKNNVNGSWNQTCINPQYIGKNMLKADCLTTDGHYVQSRINIKTCEPSGCNIYNNNGKLQCTESTQKCHFPKGDWKDTCKNDILNVTTGILSAKCQTINKDYVHSTIDINTCSSVNCEVYNNNGQLQCGKYSPAVTKTCPYPKGSWSQTCTNDFYDAYNDVLYARCKNIQGDYIPTRININSCASKCNIMNNNGQLQCDMLDAPNTPPSTSPNNPLQPPFVL
jgi:hypothetical protein